MDMERRENFRSWFTDVGYLYIIVVVVVGLIFFLKDLRQNISSARTVNQIEQTEANYGKNP